VINAKDHGWPALREHVFRRDGRCVATRADIFGDDVAPDVCSDWSEFDHIKEQIGGPKAPDDEAHGVRMCSWHHRLSQEWRATSKPHRQAVRDYLRKLYPEVWIS
jgi:hypothetical protein